MPETNTTDKVTQSFRLYQVMRANRKKGATRDQLLEATGLKPNYLGSYIAEFKRVWSANVVFNKNTKRYQIKNLKELNKTFAAAQ